MLNINTSNNQNILVDSEYFLNTDIVMQHVKNNTLMNLDVSILAVNIASQFGKFYITLPKRIQSKITDPLTYDNPRKINKHLIEWFTDFNKSIKDIKTLIMVISLAQKLNITPLNEICCYILSMKLSDI